MRIVLLLRLKEVITDEHIFADEWDDTGQGAFIRVARDPTLPAAVFTWAVFQRHALAQGRLINCIHALDPGADPACADLENHHAQFREEVEDIVLEERSKTGADGVAQDHILIEGSVAAGHVTEARRRGPVWLEGRMQFARES